MGMKNLDTCETYVYQALKAGYRMFDTAADYENESAVGKALARALEEGTVKREDVFIITKLPVRDAAETAVPKALDASLARLGLDYVDLYLIHQPYNDYYGAWRAMERLYQEGKVRAIGVSNFSPERLTDLCLNSHIPPMVNQVESHPFYHQDTALRWNIGRQVSVVTRSRSADHLKEDQDIWDFELSERDRNAIDGLDLGYSEILDYDNPSIARLFIQKRTDR